MINYICLATRTLMHQFQRSDRAAERDPGDPTRLDSVWLDVLAQRGGEQHLCSNRVISLKVSLNSWCTSYEWTIFESGVLFRSVGSQLLKYIFRLFCLASTVYLVKHREGVMETIEEEAPTHPWMMTRQSEAVSSRVSPSQAFKQVMERLISAAQFTWF